MLYYAIPRLTVHFSGLDGIFAFSWFFLALLVIGGNLAGFLYSVKKKKVARVSRQKRTQKVRRYLSQH
jgi:tetrahydromethanopterin S-methyltransferase subunit D